MSAGADPGRGAPRTWDWPILAALGVLALAPLAAHRELFGRLFWFGDEFDLIDQIDRMGFWRWMWRTFAENFVPLFKLGWGGGVVLFRGSYLAMIAMVWLTHALNVVLLGRVMRACALPWTAVILALVVFGLTPANLETLSWTVQWSAVLSATFMLLALDGFLRAPSGRASFAWAAASALSFSRGVLAGPVLALGCLWPGGCPGPVAPGRTAARVAGYVLPSVAVGVLIAALSTGNEHHMGGHWGEAAVYGAWYYLLNPAYLLFSVESWGWRTVACLGLCKLAIVGWALLRSRGRQRLLFVLLVAFELGNAALLGIGRYHTGLPTTVGSRYQYASLIGMAPLAAFWLSRLWERIPVPGGLRGACAAGILALLAVHLCRLWPETLAPFSDSRGAESRRIMLVEPSPGPRSVPGIPLLTMERARALVEKYNLH